MAKNKISSTYRLPEKTRAQIKWAAEKHHLSESEVIEFAVAHLLDHHRKPRAKVPGAERSLDMFPAGLVDILNPPANP